MNEKEQAFLIEYEQLCRKHKLCISEDYHELMMEEIADDEVLVLRFYKTSKNEGLLSRMSLHSIGFTEFRWRVKGDYYIQDGKIIKFEKEES